MGLFSFNYAKPGPGVNPDEPEKKGFFRFWEIIFEKFTKLLGTNALHALLSLPYLALLYIIAPINSDWVTNIAQSLSSDAASVESNAAMLMLAFRFMFATGVFILWGSGPSSAMYSYITRCFTRSDPVWIISDGFDKFKENFKQSMIVVIIDIVVLLLGMNAIHFYYTMYLNTGSSIWMLLTSLMIMISVIYTWMHYYIYQIMVTFECKISQLYKNAALFGIGMLPMNVLLTLLAGIISTVLFMVGFNPMFMIIIELVLLMLVTRFPIEFYAARKIKKTIVNTEEKALPKKVYIDEAADGGEEM